MTRLKNILSTHKTTLLYGASMALLLFVLKWLQWKFLIRDHSIDIYMGLIAVFFTLLGIWVARQLTTPRVETVVVEKEVYITSPVEFVRNEEALKQLDLTSREWEVLQLISQGKSNTEIANELFLSVSTIKTHASNLFVKMDVKSRVQALEKARRLKIIG